MRPKGGKWWTVGQKGGKREIYSTVWDRKDEGVLYRIEIRWRYTMGQIKERRRFIKKVHKQGMRCTYMHTATTSCLWCHATSNLAQHNSHQIGNR